MGGGGCDVFSSRHIHPGQPCQDAQTGGTGDHQTPAAHSWHSSALDLLLSTTTRTWEQGPGSIPWQPRAPQLINLPVGRECPGCKTPGIQILA